MSGESLSLLFQAYVDHLKMADGSVVIPIHNGSACEPELSWTYRQGRPCSFPRLDGPQASPRFLLPTELVDQIVYFVGQFGSLQGLVEDGVVVKCVTLRHHMPPKAKKRRHAWNPLAS